MKYLKYIVLIAAVVISAFFLYARFWATDKALNYEGPSFIQTSADGYKLSILVQNQLVNVWSDGTINNVLDIGDFGKRIHGNFGYFPNGDILFYHYDKETEFFDKLAKYLRIRDTNQNPTEGAEGFYRCNPATFDCERWSSEMPAIGDNAFGLEIDPETADVYISLTAKFELHKYSSEGILLAKTDTGLFFPNVVKLVHGQLYIADTNNHRIKVVSPQSDNFGEELASHRAEIEGSEWIWPATFEEVAGEWWVSLSGNNMAWGRIVKYSADWSSYELIELPAWSWPVGIAYFDQAVWIADLENFEVYRFSPNGDQLESLDGEQWQDLLRESNETKAYYDSISYWALVAMITCLSLGLIGVYFLDKENSQKYFREKREANKPFNPEEYVPLQFEGNEPNWYKPSKYNQLKLTIWLARMVSVLFLILFLPMFMDSEIPPDLSLSAKMVALVILMILVERSLYEIVETELGVHPKGLLIRRKGEILSQRIYENIYHTSGHLFIGKKALTLGAQDQGVVYEANVVEGYIRPRLDEAKKLKPMEAFYYLLSMGNPTAYAALIMAIMSLMILPF